MLSSVRDIRYHTHGWPILGEGSSPYLPPVDEDNVYKHLGYSKIPLSEGMFLDKVVDAYSQFEYTTDYSTHSAYSIIEANPRNGSFYTFFKGLYLTFDDFNLEGYKFAIVLLSKTATENDQLNIKSYRNDVFKTLTIVCRFYVPDPILTTLERGANFYYLDRSLLYFSNTVYSTSVDLIDFGEALISVSLYDDISPKTYVDHFATNNWYFQSEGVNHIFVGRGNPVIFKNSFLELVDIDGNLTIYLSNTDDPTNPEYGIFITFLEVQDIKNDYFWCKEIHIKSIVTTDPSNTPQDPNDNIVSGNLELNVLEEYLKPNHGLIAQPQYKNLFYISKAIAFENAKYRKIVRSKANVARYAEISTANITKNLNDKPLLVTTSDGNTLNYSIGVVPPTETSIAISLEENNGVIEKLINPYIFPILRYGGLYTPVYKILNSYHDDQEFFIKNSLVNIPLTEQREILKVSDNISSDNNGGSDYDIINEGYSRSLNDIDFYRLSKTVAVNVTEKLLLPWVVVPYEFKSYLSIVLNSTKQVVADGTVIDGGIEIADAFHIFAESIVRPYIDVLTESQKIDVLAYLVGANISTYLNFNIVDEIVLEFVRSTMMKIYSVEKLTMVDGTEVSFFISNGVVYPQSGITDGTILNITIERN